MIGLNFGILTEGLRMTTMKDTTTKMVDNSTKETVNADMTEQETKNQSVNLSLPMPQAKAPTPVNSPSTSGMDQRELMEKLEKSAASTKAPALEKVESNLPIVTNEDEAIAVEPTVQIVEMTPPQVEAPKMEPTIEAPKMEAPKIDAPAIEAPSFIEAPQVEHIKLEEPKVEHIKVEEPSKVSNDAVKPTLSSELKESNSSLDSVSKKMSTMKTDKNYDPVIIELSKKLDIAMNQTAFSTIKSPEEEDNKPLKPAGSESHMKVVDSIKQPEPSKPLEQPSKPQDAVEAPKAEPAIDNSEPLLSSQPAPHVKKSKPSKFKKFFFCC